MVLGILGTVCPEGSLHLLWTLALSRLSQFVLETLGLGHRKILYITPVPCLTRTARGGVTAEADDSIPHVRILHS